MARHASCSFALLAVAGTAIAQVAPFDPHPRAVLDLKSPDGAGVVDATWRVADVSIVGATHNRPGVDGRATGAPGPTHEIAPHAQSPDFDDSAWTLVPPDELETRRGGGRLSFEWYRLHLTVPERIGGVETLGGEIVLNLRVDDYAEVWVDGALSYRFAQAGGGVIGGWNAPNRVTLTTSATPGDEFTVAIFAINGPISESPGNYIWIRDARLELFAHPHAVAPEAVSAEIIRFDPALDAVVPVGTAVERVATGFQFTEGPVWDRASNRLLLSDPNANTIYAWSEQSGVGVFRERSGYDGADVLEYHQPGSNGLTFDAQGRLTIDQHGRRRVVRLEPDGSETVLADRYRGDRLNSPNDLVYRSDGALYFTDPAFGLPMVYDDPRKETPFQGVYMLRDGRLTLLTQELLGPNGLAFNHKETHLYVGNWDEARKVVMRYPIEADGTLGPGVVFADLTGEPGDEAIDGVKVDSRGNVYVCGPGGLWIFGDDGTRLGLVRNVESPHNIAFGGADGRTLYMTCHTGVYRMRVGAAGPLP